MENYWREGGLPAIKTASGSMRKHFVFPSVLLPGWLERNRFEVVTQHMWGGALPFPDAEQCGMLSDTGFHHRVMGWAGRSPTNGLVPWPEPFTELWWPQLHPHMWEKGLPKVPSPAGRAFPFTCFGEARNGKNIVHRQWRELGNMKYYRTISPRKKWRTRSPVTKLCHHRCPCPGASPRVWHMVWALLPPVRMDVGAYGTQNTSFPVKF